MSPAIATVILTLFFAGCAIALWELGEEVLCILLPHRDITRKGDLYLRRFYLSPRGWRWRLFLHHIVREDADPHPHDHPWPFTSWLLRRWYSELSGADERMTGMHRWLRHRSVPATFRHRITETPRGGAWTLVLAGRAEREWGFWVDGSWVPWYVYLKCPNEVAAEDVVR